MPHPLTRWFARALVGSLIVIGVVRVMAATQQAQTPPAQAVGAQGAQAASGVAPAPAPAAAPRPVTPEQKAYNDAVAIKDPTEKLAALQKVQADFPTSVNVMRLADGAILDLYLASWPEKTDDIAKLVDKAVTAIPASATPESRYNTIVPLATKLIDKKVMLDAAAALITPALANLDMAKYVAAQKAAANPNRPAQTDAALETTFKSIRSRGEEQLGRIAFEKGDFATAEKFFKEGLADSATLLRAPIALAEIEVKRGNNKGALEYYKMPAVQGKLKPSEDEAFRALYAKVNGSTAGLEKELDKFYEEKFPNPVKTEKYVPPASATDRMVLIEMFTGSGCPPCVGADLALEGLMARYPNTSVAVLAYHENIPQPDPMVVPGGAARFDYYKNPQGSHGVPTIAVDGKDYVNGSARDGAPGVYNTYVRMVDNAIAKPAKGTIDLHASIEGSKIKVTATVSKVAEGVKDARVQLVLAEQRLRFTGENGIRFHDLVVRAIAGDKNAGFALNATGDTTVEYAFDLTTLPDDVIKTLAAEMVKRRAGETTRGVAAGNYRAEGHPMTEINPSTLSVVAFVQAANREVLQAAHTDVAANTSKAGKGGK